MRTIRNATEDEVVAAFLRAEIDSERHADRIVKLLRSGGRDASIAKTPDLTDREANAYRGAMLGRVRGWGRNEGMFKGFPQRVSWELVVLNPNELAQVRYIAWDWWLERSGGTRLAVDHARRIRAGEFPGDPEWGLQYHRPIADRLHKGLPLPPLIAARDRKRPDFMVLVEGHVQLTAFFLFPEMLPAELELFLGTAEGLERWGLYARR